MEEFVAEVDGQAQHSSNACPKEVLHVTLFDGPTSIYAVSRQTRLAVLLPDDMLFSFSYKPCGPMAQVFGLGMLIRPKCYS